MGLQSVDNIEEELQKARTNLKGLNDNIRRIVGREPLESQLRNDRKRTFSNDNRDNRRAGDPNHTTGQLDNRSARHRESSPSNQLSKRRPAETKSVFSRLSGPVREEEFKPRLHSRVIKEVPTKQEIVAAQGVDEASKARNRRMFGSLLGTLQKFCQEESRLKPKEEKKAKIEQKLEAQQQQERENMKKERQNLFVTRKHQQVEIKMLEMKMNRVRELAEWEESKKPLMGFIRTKATPHIYFRPKTMNAKMEKKLEHSRSILQGDIEQRRQELQDELQGIETQYKVKPERSEGNGDSNENRRATKHNRRNNEDDDEDENDSLYLNSDDGHDGKELLDVRVSIKRQKKDDDMSSRADTSIIVKREVVSTNHTSNIKNESREMQPMDTGTVQ